MRFANALAILCVVAPLGWFFIVPGTAPGQPPAQSPQQTAFRDHDWFALREDPGRGKSRLFYEAAAASAFNDRVKAESLFHKILARDPASTDAYESFEALSHIYLRTGQYQKATAMMERRWRAFPEKSAIKSERAAMLPYGAMPDQRVARRGPGIFTDAKDLFVPLTINGQQGAYLMDTGAALSSMSESEAKRAGLVFTTITGNIGTSTGNQVPFRTAVAKTLAIGGTHFENVSFAVFPDNQEPWTLWQTGRRGIIGLPILNELDTLRWSRSGTIEAKPANQKPGRSNSNLCFDQERLQVIATVQGTRLRLILDTGAINTDLYAGFERALPDLVRTEGKKDKTSIRGVGQEATFESITIPSLRFTIGGAVAILSPAHVVMADIGGNCCAGNLGTDLITNNSFYINFKTMQMEVQ